MESLILLLSLIIFTLGCQDPASHADIVQKDTVQYTRNSSIEAGSEFEIKIDRDKLKEESDCQFKDGTHPASVKYYNPRTKHTATYELIVHVRQCNVVQIDFPNGGWLDENHIPATPIGQDGCATLTDDKGRKWNTYLHR